VDLCEQKQFCRLILVDNPPTPALYCSCNDVKHCNKQAEYELDKMKYSTDGVCLKTTETSLLL